MESGQKLWKQAKKIIPGGNMLLSKRSEMFLPGSWPSYFSKAKGCYVWDLDGRKFTDMSIMGIGTNSLGYGNDEVDEAVKRTISLGNMSTLNCPEEVFLAEAMTKIHPWAEMVRFARSGGEANAIAIRIARAATNKDKVAICGYHGWHDWYLATNLGNNKGLSEHLLPGLNPSGVPKVLQGTTIPFEFNNYEELENIVKNNELAAIKMEVQRSTPPENNFLKKIRDLCDERDIVLIFDECTSGFRENFGGIHLKYKINPDISMFGKALGNGYGITAVIGKKKIMQAAQNTFISSTFWTERIGPTAALKTLEVMEKLESWKYVSDLGDKVREVWQKLASKNNIDINIGGLKPIPQFVINSRDFLKYKTFITQEMLKKGFLASNLIFISIAHDENIIEEYRDYLDDIFKIIGECENDKRNIDTMLENEVCHSTFKRLN